VIYNAQISLVKPACSFRIQTTFAYRVKGTP
jgi:hypothetical protein